MIIISNNKHIMLHILAAIAFISIAVNVTMSIEARQYKAIIQQTKNTVEQLEITLQKKTVENKDLAKLTLRKVKAQSTFVAEVACLANNIYYEAGSESHEGKMAVGFVTLNRMANPSYPKTACNVVYQGSERTDKLCQFSWTCDPNTQGILYKSKAWLDSYAVAGQLLLLRGKHLHDVTHGAIFYHNQTVKPKWAKNVEYVKNIGEHTFYR